MESEQKIYYKGRLVGNKSFMDWNLVKHTGYSQENYFEKCI